MTTRRRRIDVLAATAALTAFFSLGRVGAQDTPAPDRARGRHLATALAGCADCHGATFAGGRAFTRGGQTVYAANLTGGAGGIAASTDADLRRAIRTGVRPDGTRLSVMPAREYAVMTDGDVDALIAFLRSLRPVDNVIPRGAAPPAPSLSPGARPPDGDERPPLLTVGAYLATIGGCTNCHGANLAGGRRIGDAVAPNISRDGIGSWSYADFQTAMRTGKTPDGRMLSKVMPWETFGKMTDDELRALYDFLGSEPDTN